MWFHFFRPGGCCLGGCAPWIGLVLAHLSDARLDSDPENVEAE